MRRRTVKSCNNPTLTLLSGNPNQLGWFQAAIPAIVSGVASITNNIISSTVKKKQQLRELSMLRDEIKATEKANKEAMQAATAWQLSPSIQQSSLIPGIPNEILSYGAIALIVANVLGKKRK